MLCDSGTLEGVGYDHAVEVDDDTVRVAVRANDECALVDWCFKLVRPIELAACFILAWRVGRG